MSGASLTYRGTYLGEDDILERRCFLLELRSDGLVSGEKILRRNRWIR